MWEGGFDHCLEVFGLTSDVKTGDLQEFLDVVLPHVKLQPRIQWSDDNHAVYVCDSVTTGARGRLPPGGECVHMLTVWGFRPSFCSVLLRG